ncbi:hypothetical protein CH341_31340, partial [Rhodoplanes roseus]
ANGDFRFDRRAGGGVTQIAAGGDRTPILDRWFAWSTGSAVLVQQLGAPTSTSRYAAALQLTVGPSAVVAHLSQQILSDDIRDLAAPESPVTLSIAIDGPAGLSIGWAAYVPAALDSFGTVASPTRTLVASGTWVLDTGIIEKAATFDLPTSATKGLEVELTASLTSSSGSIPITFYAAQLEAGAEKTGFSWRPRSVAQVEASAPRERLPADRYYFVDAATGSDQNTGRRWASAFASVQKALDTIAQLDIGIFNVTVLAKAGTYGPIVVPAAWMGSGTVTVQADTA